MKGNYRRYWPKTCLGTNFYARIPALTDNFCDVWFSVSVSIHCDVQFAVHICRPFERKFCETDLAFLTRKLIALNNFNADILYHIVGL